MASTRINNDDARIAIQLQQQTDQERWYLDVPGSGPTPSFMLDPHIIPQKWGGNLWTNTTDIQSSLLGLNKRISRDCKNVDEYRRSTTHTRPISYPVCDTFLTTEQSRAVMPAWTARDLPQVHAYLLPTNPQLHAEIPFQSYKSSRLTPQSTNIKSM